MSSEEGWKFQRLIGKTITMVLEEHPYKKKFIARIEGVATIRDNPSDKLYLLKLEGDVSKQLAHDHVLFRAGSIEFEKHFLKEALKSGGIRYESSLEDFVLNRDHTHVALLGRLYGFPKKDSLNRMVLENHELFVLAYCRIT